MDQEKIDHTLLMRTSFGVPDPAMNLIVDFHEKKIDSTYTDKNGSNLLHIVAKRPGGFNFPSWFPEYLCKHHPELITETDKKQHTPLVVAIIRKNLEVIKLLVKYVDVKKPVEINNRSYTYVEIVEKTILDPCWKDFKQFMIKLLS